MNPWLCFWKVSSQVAEEAHVPPASCVVTAPLYHVWLWEEPEPSFTTAKMFSVCCTDCHAVGCSPTAGTSSQRSLEKADALTASHLSKNKTVNASFKVVHSAALCQGEILLDAITLPSTSPHPTITGHKCMGRERQLSVLKKLLPAMSNAASRQKNSLEGMTVSAHVNKADQGQFFGPEDEQRHGIPSCPVHLSSARNSVSSSRQPARQGPWAMPCPTLCRGSVWPCANGHGLDLCQATCQQATSLLCHWCSSPCPGLPQLLQTRLPGVSQQPETNHFLHVLGQIWAPEQLTLMQTLLINI